MKVLEKIKDLTRKLKQRKLEKESSQREHEEWLKNRLEAGSARRLRYVRQGKPEFKESLVVVDVDKVAYDISQLKERIDELEKTIKGAASNE